MSKMRRKLVYDPRWNQKSRFSDVVGESRKFSHTSLPYKVVTSLKETGQYENTIIVVTTDNGGAVKVGGNNLPLRGTKGQLKIQFPDSQVPSACGMHHQWSTSAQHYGCILKSQTALAAYC